ncbi:unnamed protein product [Peniophora sp. CBMAI 1063]|nr:unnamed protein product [Peniophora sp. CBMAI 1063]
MAQKTETTRALAGVSYLLTYHSRRYPQSMGIFEFLVTARPSHDILEQMPLASAAGFVVLRNYLSITRRWYAEMNKPPRVTSELSLLFDERGGLLDEYITNPYMRGTGIWGHELSEGNIILLTKLTVEESRHGEGIASSLLQLILSEPGILRAALDTREAGSHHPATCAFAIAQSCAFETPGTSPIGILHGVGFRRVGCSAFFARALQDSRHPSLSLPAHCDAGEFSNPETAVVPVPDLTDFLRRLLQPGWSEHQQALPIHSMIASRDISEQQIVGALSRLSSPTELAHICFPDPAVLNATPLHLAAARSQAAVVETLLLTAARGNVFTATAQGRLPLDCLRRTMRLEKASKLSTGAETWSGHSLSAIQTQAALLTAMGRPVPNEDVAAWGCSCGRCIEGWFSPVMRYKICVNAEIAARTIRLELVATYAESVSRSSELYKSRDVDNMAFMRFIPEPIRESGVRAAFISGYAAVFEAIATVIRHEKIPRVEAIVNHIHHGDDRKSEAVRFFLAHGGRVEHSLEGLAQMAMDEGFRWDAERPYKGFRDEVKSQATCQNDEDYGLLQAKLSVPANLDEFLTFTWRGDFLHIWVKNDFGERWLAVIDAVIIIEVNGVETKAIDSIPLWSVGHLYDAIADGKVQNADMLKPQLKGMPRDWWFVAANHTDVVYTDDQLISGVTHEDLNQLGYIDPEFYLLIEDVEGTNKNDPQRAREFTLASRLDISPILAF